MNPRLKSALLWGAVGFMAFLVLVQGYALIVEPLVTIVHGTILAVAVAIATTASAYALEHRIAAWSARRAVDETETHGDDGKSKS
ncbi:hypothetical protein EA462_15190 [Natrarchaeobius halalkaliphilus]|uniref:DUF7981 domain-containing protein n=1 Tax=Natrarchaeobius halalkaliphilus TaxID=1679091 RepID=A0A3N6LIH1_9EURY|nr:hypothetical protein [Natrarchaeobius halalkaliphilus]RQG86989.1 hypothetical protein EA462_15190 [Natrarchaeobius halalkaliphilus]